MTPKQYPDALRVRILDVYDEGQSTLEELAERFCVSLQYVKKIRCQQLRTGQKEAAPWKRPTPPNRKVTPELKAQVRAWLAAEPDLYLREVAAKLAAAGHGSLSEGRLSRLLSELGLPRKERRSTPASATARTWSRRARRGRR